MASRPPLFRPLGQRNRRETKAAADANRGTSAERGYDADWRRLRLLHLHQNPLCVFHARAGQVVAATVADHIESIADAPARRLDPLNIQSLCKPCHDKVRQREQAAERRKAKR